MCVLVTNCLGREMVCGAKDATERCRERGCSDIDLRECDPARVGSGVETRGGRNGGSNALRRAALAAAIWASTSSASSSESESPNAAAILTAARRCRMDVTSARSTQHIDHTDEDAMARQENRWPAGSVKVECKCIGRACVDAVSGGGADRWRWHPLKAGQRPHAATEVAHEHERWLTSVHMTFSCMCV
jgi:hypothetical protein